MAADVDIQEYNGVSGTPTVKNSSTVQFKDIDNAIVEAPLVNPTVRPLGGSVYTYEKALRLYIDSPGPVNNIDSPRAYGDGSDSMPGGATLRAGTKGSYTQPIKTVSGTATVLWTTYTVSSPLALDVFNTGPWSGTDVDVGDFLYFQIELESTAVDPPVTGIEQILLAYDET
jgi:hypothetical protein